MRIFLLFLSSIIAFCFSLKAENDVTEDLELSSRSRYAFDLQTEKASVSGILILNSEDREVKGAMINEFGVTVLAFSYDRKKDTVKLNDVVSFLDKWYIKMVLKNDLKIMIHTLFNIPFRKIPKGYDIKKDDDFYVIYNLKRKLTYTFSPLLTENNEIEE